jgi:hypothetical protein
VDLVARHFDMRPNAEYHLDGSLDYTPSARHSVGFARTCLAICKYTDVESIEERLHDFFHFLEDRLCIFCVLEYSVKFELSLIQNYLLVTLVRNEVFHFRLVCFILL